MKDVTNIEQFGARSFQKARRSALAIRRRRSNGHLAFTIQSPRGKYVVRLAIERGRALAECVLASSGRPCQGFERTGHCYHTARALLFVCATAKT